MATLIIGETNCAATALNTGLVGCPIELSRAAGWFVHPDGEYLTKAQLDAVLTSLNAKVRADNKRTRWYQTPVQIGEFTDNTAEPTKITWAYGGEKVLYPGKPNYMFMPETLDVRAIERLQKLNGRGDGYRIIFYDDENKLIGTKGVDGSSNEVMQGFKLLEWYADNVKLQNQEGVKPAVYVSLANPDEMTGSNISVHSTGINLNDIKRMNDVTLIATTIAAGVVDVAVYLGKTNMVETYSTELAQSGAWKPTEALTGNAITVTSVAEVTVSGVKKMRVTLDTSDTDYPASTESLYLTLHAPSVLAGLATPLIGFEAANILTLTV